MTLRYLVPALGLLASTSLIAEDIGGIKVGAFVDTTGTVWNSDEENSNGNTGGVEYAFAANTELRLGYKIDEKVSAQVDLEWNNGNGTGRSEYLEQAFINWSITDMISLTTGKFTTYAGWVAADADGLYRVTGGPITALYGGELLGIATNIKANEDLAISIFVVNGLDVVQTLNGNDDSTGNSDGDISLAVDAVYTVKDVGAFNAEIGYDYISNAPSGDNVGELSIGLNTTINMASYKPLTLGAELIYRSISDHAAQYLGDPADRFLNASDGDNTSAMGILVMGNHTIPGAPVPMSATLMIQHVSEDIEVANVTPSVTEFSLALLTNPTGSQNFGLNAELGLATIDEDTAGSDSYSETWLALEAIAIVR